jgi:glucan phosphoethanolaminetransferase (alkaline phosphatase superfamily)
MKKKSTWIKITQVCVTAIPPVVVLCMNFPVFIESTGKSISAAGILVALILACIFKDATKRIFSTPSAFKTCLIVFLLSLIAVNLGTQMLQISATALVSGACGIPLGMWYNAETKPATTDDVMNELKNLIKEKGDEKESDENN